MSYFPIILIPVEIQRILREMPPVPEFKERMPKPPTTEPQLIENTNIMGEVTVLIVLTAIILRLNVYLGTALLVIGTVGIMVQIHLQVTSYRLRSQEQSIRMESYFRLLADYSSKESEYQQAIARSRTSERLVEFRRPLLQKFLSRASPDHAITPLVEPPETPVLKEKFKVVLERYFPHKISMHLVPNVVGFEPSYAPDLTYIDPELNLHIAIEIDEPYASDSNQPTHYRDDWQDLRCNELLLKCGWIVVRFSEEQVWRSPLSCCKTITKLIDELVGASDLLLKFADVDDLEVMKQWTQQEAQQMAANNHRQTYQV